VDLFQMLQWVETHPGTAAWVQGFGVLIAVAVAVGVPIWQQSNARRVEEAQRTQAEIDFLKRLVPAIRAEVKAAIAASDRQEVTIERTLEAMSQAKQKGHL
jgi:hypothetical protein